MKKCQLSLGKLKLNIIRYLSLICLCDDKTFLVCFMSFQIYFVYRSLIRYNISKYFPHSEGCLFCLEDTICSRKGFHFNTVQFIHFFFLFTFLGVLSEKLLPKSRSSNLLLYFLLSTSIFSFMTQSQKRKSSGFPLSE